MKQAVIIKAYNPKLPIYFKKEKKFLTKHLSKNFEIYHTGSSSVPGLGGKNVVDITLLAPTKVKAKEIIKKLELIGYTHKSNAGDETRIFFNRHHFYRKKIIYIVHIHLMWKSNNKYKDYLLFRDYLRQHPEEAKKYYNLKKIWAKKAGAIRRNYPKMKTNYIKGILKKANTGSPWPGEATKSHKGPGGSTRVLML